MRDSEPRPEPGRKDAPRVDDIAFSPTESWDLVRRQQQAVRSRLRFKWRLIYATWGLAYLLGFGTLYLQRTGALRVPSGLAGFIVFLLILVAVTTTGTHMSSVIRGVQGANITAQVLSGWAYLLGFLCVGAIVIALIRAGVHEPIVSLMLPVLSLMVMGIVYVVSGAFAANHLQFAMGCWILLVTAGSVALGLPTAHLVLALAGGGGFLLGAVLHRRLESIIGRVVRAPGG